MQNTLSQYFEIFHSDKKDLKLNYLQSIEINRLTVYHFQITLDNLPVRLFVMIHEKYIYNI